jgi:hypothetical protein
MNTRFLASLFAAGILLAVTGCQTVDTRIKEKPEVFASLDKAVQDKIKQGIIEIGYTPDMVYLALGSPSEKREKITKEGQSEIWVYSTYYDDYSGVSPLGYHRRVYFDPMINAYRIYYSHVYADTYAVEKEERIRVTFHDGKAVVIEQSK